MRRGSVIQRKNSIKKSGQNVSILGSQASYNVLSRQSRANIGFVGSSSRRNVIIDDVRGHRGGPHKAVVQVVDEQGQDVTPRSLLPQDSNALRKNQSNMNASDSSSIGTPSDLISQSIYGASTLQTSYAQGFSRSMYGSVIGSASKVSLDSITDEIAEPSNSNEFSSGLGDIQTRRAYVKEELSEADLEKEVTLLLSETDTIWHLDMPGISVAKESDIAQGVIEKNEKYEELLKTRFGNDMFIQRGMQTFNDAPKTKEMQTVPVGMEDAGCMATTWDMYDTYSKEESKAEEKESDDYMESLSRPGTPVQARTDNEALNVIMENEESSMASLHKSSSINSLMTESRASFMTTSNQSDSGDTTDRDSVSQADIELQAEKLLKLDSMKKNLFTMERAVVQNIFHPKQAAYRSLPLIDAKQPDDVGKESAKGEKEDLDTKLGAYLGRLWAYSSNLTKGKKVNCMAWNKLNQDLLAVGYGQFGLTGQDTSGLVCCWSLKNPEFPERVYHLNTAVTALDFSAAHPNLLAAGLYDGTIAILNVRHTKDKPVLDSSDSPGKHAGPIWQLKWVDRDKGTGEDKGEVLVSTSADGRVTQWSIRKGFEFQDLMKLKRLNAAKQTQASKLQKTDASKKGDALISRFVSGLCFDFQPNDGNTYLAGTEEGNVHKCSCSYNEQFLETYSAHTGPVYKLLWCTFVRDVFLSCSSDWSIRLWNQDKQQPVLTLYSTQKAVNDIDWSPSSATVIAAVNDSQIEIWDLSHSTLDPLIISATIDSNVSLSSITFSPNSETILVGDSEGLVTVYQLRSMPSISEQQTEVLSKIMNATKISQTVEEEADTEKIVEEEVIDR